MSSYILLLFGLMFNLVDTSEYWSCLAVFESFVPSLTSGKKEEGFYVRKYILGNWSKKSVFAFVTYPSFMYNNVSQTLP